MLGVEEQFLLPVTLIHYSELIKMLSFVLFANVFHLGSDHFLMFQLVGFFFFFFSQMCYNEHQVKTNG